MQNIVNGTTGRRDHRHRRARPVTLFNPGAERLLGYAAEEMVGTADAGCCTPTAAVAEKAEELGVDQRLRAPSPRALIGRGPDRHAVRPQGRRGAQPLDVAQPHRGRPRHADRLRQHLRGHHRAARGRAGGCSRPSRPSARPSSGCARSTRSRTPSSPASATSCARRSPASSATPRCSRTGRTARSTPEQLDAVHRVGTNSSRLLSLIDDLLTLSRIQEEGSPWSTGSSTCARSSPPAARSSRPSLERRDLDLTLDLPELPMPFLGDRDMLERVVINLVGNAVKFTPEGGQVDVALRSRRARPSCSRSATPASASPRHEQEQLFTRFFRSSLAQEQAIPGSGLGPLDRPRDRRAARRLDLGATPRRRRVRRSWSRCPSVRLARSTRTRNIQHSTTVGTGTPSAEQEVGAMPAVTVADLTVLDRLREPGLGRPDASPVWQVSTAPQGYEGEGFPVRRAFAGIDLQRLDPFIMMDQMGEVEYAARRAQGHPVAPAPRLRDRHLHHRRHLRPPGQPRWRRHHHQRRHPVDDRRVRPAAHRGAAGVDGAAGRPLPRHPALGEPAARRQDDRPALPGHPLRRGPAAHLPGRRRARPRDRGLRRRSRRPG